MESQHEMPLKVAVEKRWATRKSSADQWWQAEQANNGRRRRERKIFLCVCTDKFVHSSHFLAIPRHSFRYCDDHKNIAEWPSKSTCAMNRQILSFDFYRSSQIISKAFSRFFFCVPIVPSDKLCWAVMLAYESFRRIMPRFRYFFPHKKIRLKIDFSFSIDFLLA